MTDQMGGRINGHADGSFGAITLQAKERMADTKGKSDDRKRQEKNKGD